MVRVVAFQRGGNIPLRVIAFRVFLTPTSKLKSVALLEIVTFVGSHLKCLGSTRYATERDALTLGLSKFALSDRTYSI
jgi:hypothetical protein